MNTTIQTNMSADGIARSLLRQQSVQANELAEQMAQQFWTMIGTANQVAFVAMDDAMEAMEDCGMLRQQVKVKAQRAMQEYERYDQSAYRHFHEMCDDRYNLWADLVTRSAERLQPDVQKLYFAVKNVIDRHGVKNSEALAKIQTALALVTLSTLMFDTLLAEFQQQTMYRLEQSFRGGRLTAVESNWKAVGELTGRQVMQDVDLRNDAACALGVQVILTRYQKADFMNEAAHEALELNPEMTKYIKDDGEGTK